MMAKGLSILILPVQGGPENSPKVLQWLLRDAPRKSCCSRAAFTLPARQPEVDPIPADSSRGSPPAALHQSRDSDHPGGR